MRVQNSGNARDSRRKCERHQSELGNVDTNRLSRDVVVADCHAGASGAGVDEIHQDNHAYHQHDDHEHEVSILRGFDSLCALEYYLAGLLVGVGDSRSEAEVQTVLVHCEVDVVGKRLDYLTEAESYDSEVVAAEPQYRDTDEYTEYRRCDTADYQCKYHSKPGGVDAFFGHQREYAADVSADAHESRMSEGKLTEDTDREVQRDGEDNVNTYRYEKSGILAAKNAGH